MFTPARLGGEELIVGSSAHLRPRSASLRAPLPRRARYAPGQQSTGTFAQVRTLRDHGLQTRVRRFESCWGAARSIISNKISESSLLYRKPATCANATAVFRAGAHCRWIPVNSTATRSLSPIAPERRISSSPARPDEPEGSTGIPVVDTASRLAPT